MLLLGVEAVDTTGSLLLLVCDLILCWRIVGWFAIYFFVVVVRTFIPFISLAYKKTLLAAGRAPEGNGICIC